MCVVLEITVCLEYPSLFERWLLHACQQGSPTSIKSVTAEAVELMVMFDAGNLDCIAATNVRNVLTVKPSATRSCVSASQTVALMPTIFHHRLLTFAVGCTAVTLDN